MTDRLPLPMDGAAARITPFGERASATPSHVRHRVAEPAAESAPSRARTPASLSELQLWVLSSITEGEPSSTEVDRVLTPGPRLSARDRFEVYRAGYDARLLECLRDDYPVTAETLGEEDFAALCHAYVRAYPSRSPNLNLFGGHLTKFLLERSEIPGMGPISPFFRDLTALEWALVEVLHAETPAPFDLATLQAVPIDAWACARFLPSEAVRVRAFEYPVNAYYQACRTGDRPASLPSPGTSKTAVYRRGLKLWRMDLTPAMARVLEALLSRETLGEALGRIETDASDPEALAEAERSVMVWFREWVNAGFFGGVVLE